MRLRRMAAPGMMRNLLVGTIGVLIFAGTALASGQFGTTATGANEVPPRDSTAQAQLSLKIGKDSAHFKVRVTSPIEDVFMAHLHKGAPGVNGPVAIWIFPEDAPNPFPPAPPAIDGSFDGKLADGRWDATDLCWSPAAPYCVNGVGQWDSFIADLENGLLYFNVHTTAFPGGEIRGQVSIKGS